MLKKPRPTDGEMAILRVLWDYGPATVRQIHEKLGRDTAYTTVLKLLQIMMEKGIVSRDESIRTHVYSAAQPAALTQKQIVKDLLDRVFAGSSSNLVLQALAAKRPRRKNSLKSAALSIPIKRSSHEPPLVAAALAPKRSAGRCFTPFGNFPQSPRSPSSRLIFLRHHAPHVRYAVGYTLLLAMIVAAIGTYALLWTHLPHSALAPPNARAVTFNVPLITLGAAHLASTVAVTPPTMRDRALTLLHALLPYTAVLYLTGAALLTLRLLAGYTALRRLRFNAQAAAEHHELLETLRDRLSISSPVQLLLSSRVEVPTVLGALRPLILLPLTTTAGLSTEHLTCLLLHELAHIRRHDYLANLVQSLIETLLFYHPAVAWLSAQVRREREHCCDDMAAAATGNRARYAAALVSMESLRTTSRNLAMAANGGSLLVRIQRLLRPASPRRLSQRIISGSSLIAAAVVVAGFACYLAACSRNDTPSGAPTTSASTAPAEPIVAGAASATAPSPNRPAQVGDALSISIYELLAPGTNYTDIFPVDEKGNVHLPYVGDVPAFGKTPRQIADAIASTAVGKSLLREPQVVVSHTDEIADLRPLKQGDAVFIKVLELETSGKMTDETAVVDEKGDVPVLHLGRIHVVGLTPTQASARIASTAVDMSVLRPPAYAQVSRFVRNWPHISVESRHHVRSMTACSCRIRCRQMERQRQFR